MSAAPTPRDLFGSRGRIPSDWKGSRHYRGIPSLQPVVGPPAEVVADFAGEESSVRRWPERKGRMHPNGRHHYRPAAGYGGDGQSISVGMSWICRDDGDMVGFVGETPPRPVHRANTPFREWEPPLEALKCPEDHPAHSGRAACAGTDPRPWVHDTKGPQNPSEVKLMRRICGVCPVREACLQWALANERFGFWAGYTQPELEAIRQANTA